MVTPIESSVVTSLGANSRSAGPCGSRDPEVAPGEGPRGGHVTGQVATERRQTADVARHLFFSSATLAAGYLPPRNIHRFLFTLASLESETPESVCQVDRRRFGCFLFPSFVLFFASKVENWERPRSGYAPVATKRLRFQRPP